MSLKSLLRARGLTCIGFQSKLEEKRMHRSFKEWPQLMKIPSQRRTTSYFFAKKCLWLRETPFLLKSNKKSSIQRHIIYLRRDCSKNIRS
jgi:hypothetical protein